MVREIRSDYRHPGHIRVGGAVRPESDSGKLMEPLILPIFNSHYLLFYIHTWFYLWNTGLFRHNNYYIYYFDAANLIIAEQHI